MSAYNLLRNFNSSTTDENAKNAYDKWAKEYEKDVAAEGYVGYINNTKIFDEELKKCFGEERFSLKILDAGAGTGLVGQILKDIGYSHVDGLDISQKMLDIAHEKGIYCKLICAGISEQRIDEIQDGEYDATISSGTITVGHVKPSGLNEILRHVKQGGLICFTLRQDAYDNSNFGYRKLMDELAQDKKWEQIGNQLVEYHKTDKKLLEKCYLFTYKVL